MGGVKMKNKKPESFALAVGISTIVGAIATVVAIFLNNGNTMSNENNSGIINQNSGDVINQQGDNPTYVQGNLNINYGESNNDNTETPKKK